MDYTFMEDLKILSFFACSHHEGAATAVERKGPYPWIVAWIAKRLAAMGVMDCRMRTDPEETITDHSSRETHEDSLEEQDVLGEDAGGFSPIDRRS